MIASFSQRFVFLHIPKNAGSAFRQSLRGAFLRDRSVVEGWGIEDGVDLAHPLPAFLRKRFPSVYELLADGGTNGIAVLRDPLDRCLAAFREHRLQYGDHPDACGTLSGYLDHIEAGSYREENGTGYIFIHGAPQREFLFEGDELLYKDLLRLDDEVFYHKLCLLVGADLAPLARKNVGTGRSYVPAAEVRRILKLYEQDYELMDSLD
ncbi:MAG: hypothetical protein EOP84_14570 [Verrucomicrobiaceae bacterium]|nr:MAG: hypothetical protein EOP84_14570 [Verrucomicrobiaceae bacterium]